MCAESANPDLLSMWKRSMDEGMEAWRKLMGQPQAPDLFQFWRPLFGQTADPWTQMLKQGATDPDILAQWKKFMDDSIEAWSKALGQAMETEGFAAAMGKFLEQYLNAVGPTRKSLQSTNEEFLRTSNLPSRKQVTDLASQVVSLDLRMEGLEERLDELIGGLSPQAPPRQQSDDLTRQIDSLDERLRALQERIDTLLRAVSPTQVMAKGAGEQKEASTPRGMKPPSAARKIPHKEA